LIKPFVVDNHYIWSNRNILNAKKESREIRNQDIDYKSKKIGFPLPKDIKSKREIRKLLNNCVRPETGLHIFNSAFKTKQEVLV